jgi:hypothetical protein
MEIKFCMHVLRKKFLGFRWKEVTENAYRCVPSHNMLQFCFTNYFFCGLEKRFCCERINMNPYPLLFTINQLQTHCLVYPNQRQWLSSLWVCRIWIRVDLMVKSYNHAFCWVKDNVSRHITMRLDRVTSAKEVRTCNLDTLHRDLNRNVEQMKKCMFLSYWCCKQDRQFTYNKILRRVRATIFAVVKQ